MSGDKILAMIPARLGSQRLAKKNLRHLDGVPLIVRAVRKCVEAGCFDEVWVNSESEEIASAIRDEDAQFHPRPAELANNAATSEQFVAEFLETHDCEAVVQVHSIAPLLTAREVRHFVEQFKAQEVDVMLSCIEDQIEVAYRNEPVNFTFAEKTNSQDLEPVQRITWSITAWRRETYLDAVRSGNTATYHGRVGFFPVGPISGHVIKTERDLRIAAALLRVLQAPTTDPRSD